MLGAAVAGVLPQLQAEARSLMTDPTVIRRPLGVVPDPVTGADVQTYQPGAVYAGPGKLQSQAVQVLSEASADSTRTVQRLEVHIPVGNPVQIGDVAFLRGRTFRITGISDKTWQTAQRLPAEELT